MNRLTMFIDYDPGDGRTTPPGWHWRVSVDGETYDEGFAADHDDAARAADRAYTAAFRNRIDPPTGEE